MPFTARSPVKYFVHSNFNTDSNNILRVKMRILSYPSVKICDLGALHRF